MQGSGQFINPTKADPDTYAGKVGGKDVSIKQLDDGSLAVDDGSGVKTFPQKQNSFGPYWIVDAGGKVWLVSFGTSRSKGTPYAKFVESTNLGSGGGGNRQGPAQFGKR